MNLNTEISFAGILKKLLMGWKYLLLSAFLGAVLAFLCANYFITPKYTSYISLYVNNTHDETQPTTVDISDINASRSLVNTYMAFLKSDYILSKIAEIIDREEYSSDMLTECINCQDVESTEIFKVFVETTDPILSAQIGNCIAEIAPAEIERVFGTGKVEVIDFAKVPEHASSPNIRIYTLSGIIGGLFIAALIITILGILNQKIKSPEDFDEHYHIPLLGILPNIFDNKE